MAQGILLSSLGGSPPPTLGYNDEPSYVPALEAAGYILLCCLFVDQLDCYYNISKPNFSYTKGKDIVASHGYNNLYELQDKSITSFRLKHTKLVPEAYLYAGEKNNVRHYILLSPIDGEIETEKIGDGNYLDKYFQMKYGR